MHANHMCSKVQMHNGAQLFSSQLESLLKNSLEWMTTKQKLLILTSLYNPGHVKALNVSGLEYWFGSSQT